MLIKRTSILTNETHTLEINIREEDLKRYENNEGPIQDIVPYLSEDDREFIMTGITPKEWSKYMEGQEV